MRGFNASQSSRVFVYTAMFTLNSFLRFEVGAMLAVLGGIVGYQLLSGKINFKGLLFEKKGSRIGGYSPLRLQLLLITLAAAAYYLALLAETFHTSAPY